MVANDLIVDVVIRCYLHSMRPAILLTLLMALSACVSTQSDSNEKTMDGIENSITLPPNALALESYARYYTEHRGLVIGAFTTVVEGTRPPDYGCEELQLDFTSKSVPCPAVADVRIGSRRWVSFADLPSVAGKDCTALRVEYDPMSKNFTLIDCAKLVEDF